MSFDPDHDARTTILRRFAAWVLAGAILDAVVLIGLWMGLHALGPLLPGFTHWLNGVGLVAAPWLVHVLLLPRLFHVVAPEMRGTGWLVRSMVFMLSSALIIPALGTTAFFFFGIPYYLLVSWGASQTWFSHPLPREEINGDVLLIIIAVAVGAAVGLLLHITRRGNLSGDAVSPNEPGFRSDVLGGGLAAGLVFAGMFVGRALGWFSPSINGSEDWTDSMALPPHPTAIVLIIAFAMLPHVIMIGRELLIRPARNRP